MNQLFFGFVLFGALASLIECEPIKDAEINSLAQKLEDIYHGKTDVVITYDELDEAVDNFEALTDDDRRPLHKVDELEVARGYLNDFGFKHLDTHPKLRKEYKESEEKAQEFIKKLVDTYKRFRPIYRFETNLKDCQYGEHTMVVLKHLLGRGTLPTKEQYDAALKETRQIAERQAMIVGGGENIYDDLDEFEQLCRFRFTPEIAVWEFGVLPHVHEDRDCLCDYLKGEEKEVKKFREIYQNGLKLFREEHNIEVGDSEFIPVEVEP